MGCNCKWFEVIVAIVVFVLALWPGLLGAEVTKWVLVVAAVALVVHAFKCANCGACKNCMPGDKGMAMEKKSMSSKPAMDDMAMDSKPAMKKKKK